MPTRQQLSVLALLFTACVLPADTVPPGALLTCAQGEPCPVDYVCMPGLDRCVLRTDTCVLITGGTISAGPDGVACEQATGTSGICLSGECQPNPCSEGQTYCHNASENQCTTPAADEDCCGTSRLVCPGGLNNRACNAGSCALVCVNGGCARGNYCGQDDYCHAGCTASTECPPGETCNAVGLCVTVSETFDGGTDSADCICLNGQACPDGGVLSCIGGADLDGGSFDAGVATPTECASDSECSLGLVCVSNGCASPSCLIVGCASDSYCGDGGECITGCLTSADCVSGQTCTNAFCQ